MLPKQSLFTSKRFLPLCVTQFFGAFNDNAFKNAFLVWFTYDVGTYHGFDASFMVALAGGIFILPFFLFSATAGQLADTYEKAWLTRKIKCVEIVLMLLCGLFFFTKSIGGLLIVLFLMGVQSTFFGPIKYSLLPEHLKKEELIAGNAWIEGATFLSILLGTMFGGIVIALPYGTSLLALFLVAFSIIGYASSFFIPESCVQDTKSQLRWNIIRETQKIIGYTQKDSRIWHTVLGISWFWFIGMMFISLFPLYTSYVIGGNEFLVTLYMTIFSLGIGLGSFLCNIMIKGKISTKFVTTSAFGMSASIFLLCIASLMYVKSPALLQVKAISADIGIIDFFATDIWSYVICLSILLLSVSGGIYIVPLYAIMQHNADKKYISRIIAGNNIVNAFFMVCASLASMLLLGIALSTISIFFIVGIINGLIHAYVAIAMKRSKKHA